jgi:recombination protein RecR
MNNVPLLDQLTQTLGKLPGLGPRSARRVLLHLLKKPESVLLPLINLLQATAEQVKICTQCGNVSLTNPCPICADNGRNHALVCAVSEVEDLWAIERGGSFKGIYQVLGGTLSALDGVRPEDLHINRLLQLVQQTEHPVAEVILALAATVDGQATSFYVAEQLQTVRHNLVITRLSLGVPLGGELDYLDDGTLAMALQARQSFGENSGY